MAAPFNFQFPKWKSEAYKDSSSSTCCASGKVTVKGHDCIRFSPAGKIVSLLTFGPAFPKS
jgi:hypothetical protein